MEKPSNEAMLDDNRDSSNSWIHPENLPKHRFGWMGKSSYSCLRITSTQIRVLTLALDSNQIMWVSTWRLAFGICVRLDKIAAAGPLPALGFFCECLESLDKLAAAGKG